MRGSFICLEKAILIEPLKTLLYLEMSVCQSSCLDYGCGYKLERR